jgi:hypothetical protein
MSSKSIRTWTVVLTGLGSLMAALDTLVVSTALSTIRLDPGASIEELEWTVNAYNLSFAVLLITAAALGDRYGRRRLYALGLGLFAAASAACALAPEVGWLIAARAVQGFAAAMVLTLGLALLSAAFPPERRGAAIGIFSAITGLSVASGPVVGGAVVEGNDWEWIFWLNVPLGLAAVPLVLSRMKESFGGDTGLDAPRLALVTGAALAIVGGGRQGRGREQDDARARRRLRDRGDRGRVRGGGQLRIADGVHRRPRPGHRRGRGTLPRRRAGGDGAARATVHGRRAGARASPGAGGRGRPSADRGGAGRGADRLAQGSGAPSSSRRPVCRIVCQAELASGRSEAPEA